MSTPRIRANEVLSRFVANTEIRGAEIGVSIGQMSECLLADWRVYLLMVDSWLEESKQPKHYLDAGDYHAHLSHAEQRAHREMAETVTDFAGERRTVVRLASVDAARMQPDDDFDFVFIDADHSEEGCAADIEAWRLKVHDGGYLCGHDYGYLHTPGVKIAVDKAVEKHGWTLELGANYTWFARQ